MNGKKLVRKIRKYSIYTYGCKFHHLVFYVSLGIEYQHILNLRHESRQFIPKNGVFSHFVYLYYIKYIFLSERLTTLQIVGLLYRSFFMLPSFYYSYLFIICRCISQHIIVVSMQSFYGSLCG